MNLYELFKKFETEFLAGHEKIKTELDFELFVGKLSEQILGDVYSLDTVYKTGGNHIEVTAVGYLNTTFNNAPVQIVNYASEGFWQIGIGNN